MIFIEMKRRFRHDWFLNLTSTGFMKGIDGGMFSFGQNFFVFFVPFFNILKDWIVIKTYRDVNIFPLDPIRMNFSYLHKPKVHLSKSP